MIDRNEPNRNRRCPECGSERVVPIVYGFPTPELERRAERGEVALGGCLLPADATRYCSDCDSEW